MSNSTPNDTLFDRNHVFRRLASGFSAVVWATIPKQKAAPILNEYWGGPLTLERQAEYCLKLQAACEATKVIKSADPLLLDFLKTELEVLNALRHHTHPNVGTMIEHNQGEHLFSQELLHGRRLQDLIDACTNDIEETIPTAFFWNLILHIARAFLFLHFGITNNITDPNAPSFAHRDATFDNIMFRTPARDGYNDYPEAVLIDFGISMRYDASADNWKKRMFFSAQYQEVNEVFHKILEFMKANGQVDPLLQTLVEELNKLEENGTDNDRVRDFLLSLVSTAERRREESYQPLGPKLTEYFSRQVVTVGEIATTFGLFTPQQ